MSIYNYFDFFVFSHLARQRLAVLERENQTLQQANGSQTQRYAIMHGSRGGGGRGSASSPGKSQKYRVF